MLQVSYTRIREDAIPRVRDWLGSLRSREAELRELARAQTISDELAHLISGEDGPVLVYAIVVDDLGAAREAIQKGSLPIAREWRALMSECSAGHPAHEVLLDRGAEHP
jgi:hypothetical protein